MQPGRIHMEFMTELEQIIHERKKSGSTDSYVSKLCSSGTRRIAQKVGEEAVEFALAAAAGNREDQVEEASDLLFHILVLLANLDIPLSDVDENLRLRHNNRTAGSIR